MPATAEGGPVNGHVWPILISVSVAPVSYFFCADAGETDSAMATAVPMNRCKMPFLISLRSLMLCADDLVRCSTMHASRCHRSQDTEGKGDPMQDNAMQDKAGA